MSRTGLFDSHAHMDSDYFTDDRDALVDAFDPEWKGEVPLTVLITPEGKVAWRATGSVDVLELRRAILRELDARKPW